MSMEEKVPADRAATETEETGDFRRMRSAADGEIKALRGVALRKVPGLGPAGADIFLSEAQAVWREFAPRFDAKAMRGAERLGLPTDVDKLARLVDAKEVAALAAALVRAALDKAVVDDVRSHVQGGQKCRTTTQRLRRTR